MATAAIIGTAGYAGQETLDRVLAHPDLELVALGSDSLAGQAAARLDPRLDGSLPAFVTNAEAAAAAPTSLPLPRARRGGGVRAAGRRRRRRPLRRAPPGRSGAGRKPGTATAPGAWSYGLPELVSAPRGG